MYLYLDSRDSAEYFPDNSSVSFTAKLAKNIQFSPYGQWFVTVADIDLPPLQIDYKPKFLVLYSDICTPSIYGGGLKQVLHRIYYRELHLARPIVFNPPRYKPISAESLDTIRLYLLDDEGNRPSFRRVPLLCTLHVKKNPDQ